MRKIFISYRRVEGEYAAGALGRELRHYFGEGQVFRDKEDIGGGQAWKRQILLEIDRGCAMLVLLGKDWADIKDSQGKRRLDNPEDPIRLEIADGLKDGAEIIPVLLENAQMPDESELPPDLQQMAGYNALKLRDGDWDYDLKNILKTLERVGFKPATATPVLPENTLAPPTPKQTTSAKAIVGGIMVLTGLAALGADDLDREGHIGVAVFAIAGMVLGALAWRDTKQDQGIWRIVSIVITSLAGITFLGALGGMKSVPSPMPQNTQANAYQAYANSMSAQTATQENHPSTPAVSYGEPGSLQLLHGHAVVHFDAAQWSVDTQNAAGPGNSQYVHSSGELYMKIIPERIQIGLEKMAEIGVSNIRKIDPNAIVTRQGSQRVNGLEMKFREIEATMQDIPITYYAYYYSDPAGSIQLIGWTGRSLIGEYRSTIEQFVAGFQVAQATY